MVRAAAESALRPACRRDRTRAAHARRSSDAARTAGSTRGTGRRPRIRRVRRSMRAEDGRPLHATQWRGPVIPVTLTCSRSTDESTYRAVPVPLDLLAQHMPRLDRLPHFDRDAVVGDRAEARKTEFDERVEPALVHRVPERVEIRDDVANIRRDEMRQQPSIVQRRAPAHEVAAIRLLPEPRDQRAQQQRLHEAHPRMRRHFERAKLEQPEAPGCRVGRVELVDRELGAMRIAREVGQQMAQQPVDEPRRGRRLPCLGSCAAFAGTRSRARRAGRRALRRHAATGSSVR